MTSRLLAPQYKTSAVFAGCLGLIALYIILMLLGALVIMIGWNLSMPSIFGFKEIGIGEGFGLSILSGALTAPKIVADNK